MKYKIYITSSVENVIKKLNKSDILSIKTKIDSLEKNPFPLDYKKLKGFAKAVYRIKTDDKRFRILYTADKNLIIIKIIRVALRKDSYKDLAALTKKS